MLNRVTSCGRLLAELQLDAACFFGMPSVRYLCGFTGSDGVLVVGREQCWFLSDSRYTTQAEEQVVGADVLRYATKSQGVAEILQREGFKRVGFEAAQLSVAGYQQLVEAAPAIAWQSLTKELETLRSIKTPAELELLSAAADLASAALSKVLGGLRAGMSEQDVAVELEYQLRCRGAESTAFDCIVASGSRGALPHGRASAKPLQRGELLTIDYGAIVAGYCSDETVTVALGKPDHRQREIYTLVLEAHDRAIAAIKPGVPLKEIDAAARSCIADAGYAEYFGHGLGHGIGLEVHEQPVVSPRSEGVAVEGMVFTVEPGIYLPGWGGVRIEDMVAVTADGYRLLTSTTKQLVVLDV